MAKWPLHFKAQGGAPLPDNYGGKTILDWNGEPVFADLAIVRALQAEGLIGMRCHRVRAVVTTVTICKKGARGLMSVV